MDIYRFCVLLKLVLSLVPSKAQIEGEVRLVGFNSSHKGRAELYYDGEWGTLCDNDYGKASHVICYQLNYTAPPASHWGNSFRNLNESLRNSIDRVSDNMTIHFWDIDCGPVFSDPISVLHLLRCEVQEMNRDIQCSHDDDLVVFCKSEEEDRMKPYETQVRLVRSGNENNQAEVNTTSAGTLELFLNGTWGNLCLANFTRYDGDTACRQIGYTSSLEILGETLKTTKGVWVLNKNCYDSKECMNCCFEDKKSEWKDSCSDGKYVGLSCNFSSELSVNLTSGNPIMCNYTKRYNKVPAYFIGIMGGAFIQWLVTVTLIIAIAICFNKESCPGYKYRHKTDNYVTIQ